MLACYAVRCLMQAAAAALDSDDLSFTPAVQVVRRRLQNPGPRVGRAAPGCLCRNPRGMHSFKPMAQYWA